MLAETSVLRRGILLMAISVLLALIVAVPKAASGQSPGTNQSSAGDSVNTNEDQDITVMSRNLYLGADLDPAVEAAGTGDPNAFITANSLAWKNVQETNFPERAEALADEIKQSKPLLVGLQEATLWQSGPPDSIFSPPGSPPNATNVEFDYLAILLKKLEERGLPYEPVVTNKNYDIESVADTDLISDEIIGDDLGDIRITDRDVILARTDVSPSELQLSNEQSGNFKKNNSFAIGDTGLRVPLLHGWSSVDATVHGKTLRFINTHLEPESPNPDVNDIQVDQANEILEGPADTDLPVILAGDYNSRADRKGTLTYGNLLKAAFADAWSSTHPGERGYTCCQAADLSNPTSMLNERIDLVMFRKGEDKGQGLRALAADIVGESPEDRTPPASPTFSRLWPSDHAGVVATLRWQDG